MVAIGSLLLLIGLSLVVNRIATLVLVATGMSRTAARFQARSALTGAGFTTTESEQVVGHPIRRRVIMTLMLVGNAGIVASAGTLILGFNHGSAGQSGITAGELIGGLFLLVYVSRSRWVDRRLTRLILRLLRRYTTLLRRDVDSLVELSDRFAVAEVFVRSGDWVAGRALGELELDAEGVQVLGVKLPDEGYRSSPGPATTVAAGSTLVVYGNLDRIGELDGRRAGRQGDEGHDRAVAEQGPRAIGHPG